MTKPLLLALACCTALGGCGAPLAARAPEPRAIVFMAEAAALDPVQVRRALAVIGERLYGPAFTYDYQKNDATIAKTGRNGQGNHAWLVLRDLRATEKVSQCAFLANEYTRDEAGVMQTQYKVTGVIDVKANAVLDIRKEVEDRDPR